MMKKVFRPFWSYDIEKTEDWLTSMALQGYHLVKINMLTRYFYFEEGISKEVIYSVGYDKTYHTLPSALVNEGWQEMFTHKNWNIIANEKPVDEIKFEPIREGIVNRNRKIMYLFGGILIYLIFSSLIPIVISTAFLFTPDSSVTIVGSPMWIVTITVGIVLWTLCIYSILKLYKTNKELEINTYIKTGKTSPNRREEKRLKKSADVIVKRRFGWMYSPDKLEKWLEGMEEQGYNLYRINRLGTTFFFRKVSARKVSYFADYQNNTNQGYFDMHQEAGWKLMYTSKAPLSKWSIWAQAYEEGDQSPELYTDRLHMLKHARRVAITHISLFVPVIILYILIISLNIHAIFRVGMDKIMWMTFIIYGIVIIEFSIFVIKSWLYYRRTKRNFQYS
ncbi:hypothetical protein CIL05_17725 [Virgibacillus profundi]|uniref:DUF2812 domain-containing protein n=1 Tax=Virgibacillus profundi TaxID=2024555 RepID=A0A2A2IAN6_9BACI|nr:DUF2812 domain-containing protein [Virgibacillus profundi]PAV28205.1 hypothetical protein CIL05_17725 [Virgibacillus profundi]PXY52510.1 DUF2812 domain-containing protein [Virgibacillus profundi]